MLFSSAHEKKVENILKVGAVNQAKEIALARRKNENPTRTSTTKSMEMKFYIWIFYPNETIIGAVLHDPYWHARAQDFHSKYKWTQFKLKTKKEAKKENTIQLWASNHVQAV